MFEPSAEERALPSVLLDKYRLEREVGRGGMGVVYLATHTALQQRVAIKIVLPALAANPNVIQRVLREARCAAQITGDHVVRVIDVGQLPSGQPFIVMEYVEGEDLARILARQLPPRALAVHWVLEACVAIAEAHSKGIVHRDLKPANLFLARGADGGESIKVLDFGISKQLGSGEGPVTRAGDVMGSPNYMAPEQIRTPLLVDARADLWSLGAILLELLTGKRAFPGETITAVYTRVLEGQPELPNPNESTLPADLIALLRRSLEKDPNHRFQTLHEFVDALSPFADARSSSALRAIWRRLERTAAESARGRGDALGSSSGSARVRGVATGSLASAPPPVPSAPAAVSPRARLGSAFVPGLCLGLALSVAGATWLVHRERGVAPRQLVELEFPASAQAQSLGEPHGLDAAAARAHGLGLSASEPGVDAGRAELAVPAPSEPSPRIAPITAAPDLAAPGAFERSSALAARVVSAHGAEPMPRPGELAASSEPARPSEPAHANEPARSTRFGSPHEPHLHQPAGDPQLGRADLRERPPNAAASPPARNPWDISTFGGRS